MPLFFGIVARVSQFLRQVVTHLAYFVVWSPVPQFVREIGRVPENWLDNK
jgi:hypothetical protein